MVAPAKPAATVVLMRDRAQGSGGPEVLLVERHGASSFGAGAYVFPGGMVEPQDCSAAALRLSSGLTPEQAAASLNDLDDPAEAIGYYVAAIRETFEEALVLLAEGPEGAAPLPPREELSRTRDRLIANELDFTAWVAGAGLRLATHRLVYFAHWITPEAVPQRFSARFFLIQAPREVDVVTDGQEVLRHRWLQPAEAIALRRQGDIHLMDPTVRNLELLGAFASTEEALRELNRRAVTAILPKLTFNPDGSRKLTYPWDADYEHA